MPVRPAGFSLRSATPWGAYASRGIATLWAPAPQPQLAALIDLLGRARTRLLQMVDEPLATIEIARGSRSPPALYPSIFKPSTDAASSHGRPTAGKSSTGALAGQTSSSPGHRTTRNSGSSPSRDPTAPSH
jgi:hypothetical protein